MAKGYKLSDEEKEKAKKLLNQMNDKENKNKSIKVDTQSENNIINLKDTSITNNKIPSYRIPKYNLSEILTTSSEKLSPSIKEDLNILNPEYRKAKEINEEIEKRRTLCSKCYNCKCCTKFSRGSSTRNCRNRKCNNVANSSIFKKSKQYGKKNWIYS